MQRKTYAKTTYVKNNICKKIYVEKEQYIYFCDVGLIKYRVEVGG